MQTEAHPLESFFQDAVRKSFVDKLGLNDPEMIDYVAHLLCQFMEPDNLHRLREVSTPVMSEMAAM